MTFPTPCLSLIQDLETNLKGRAFLLTNNEKYPFPGQFTPLVAAMAVFAAVCVMGVSYFAWNLKRKRGVVRSYQLLSTTPDE